MFKKMLNEFKKFALKGNVLDMAVGIIVGANFSKIVDSLVNDVIMPPIGLLLGRVDFQNLFLVLHDGKIPGPYNSLSVAKQAGAVTINYGMFINTIIGFTIVAFAVFMLVKAVNTLKEKMEAEEAAKAPAAPATKECPFCLSTIPAAATKCSACTTEQPQKKGNK